MNDNGKFNDFDRLETIIAEQLDYYHKKLTKSENFDKYFVSSIAILASNKIFLSSVKKDIISFYGEEKAALVLEELENCATSIANELSKETKNKILH